MKTRHFNSRRIHTYGQSSSKPFRFYTYENRGWGVHLQSSHPFRPSPHGTPSRICGPSLVASSSKRHPGSIPSFSAPKGFAPARTRAPQLRICCILHLPFALTPPRPGFSLVVAPASGIPARAPGSRVVTSVERLMPGGVVPQRFSRRRQGRCFVSARAALPVSTRATPAFPPALHLALQSERIGHEE